MTVAIVGLFRQTHCWLVVSIAMRHKALAHKDPEALQQLGVTDTG